MPNLNKNIFNRKKSAYLISKYDFSELESSSEKLQILNQWVRLVRSQSFITTKETALQGGFLNEIIGTLLGYSTQTQNSESWNINHEQVTSIDGKFADGALGFFGNVSPTIRAVIELKDPRTNLDERQHRFNDSRTPVEQAFSYQHKIGRECRWVIVSNFREIRLYHASSSTEYEIFYIDELDNSANLKKFYYLMNFENLVSLSSESIIDSFYKTNQQDEQDISKQFYTVFKQVRVNLFNHLKENNPEIDELILIEKTQNLLDRFIFVCFCEDNHLLPEAIFKQIVQNAEKSFSFSDTKVWNEVRGLFHAINEGSPAHNINKFNGGLFARDEILDGLVIKDSILKEMSRITDYDFDSDVDVNILGHIFEQSINDIEELKSRISGNEFDKKTSKRKKDGIYYTPEYITKYIVENAVGGWLEDRKQELGYFALPELKDSDYKSISTEKGKTISSENVKQHLNFWNQYKEYLMNIKVLDPACGSGAFLNQAFNYLFAEGRKVNETIAALTGGQREVFQLDRHILSNNLYGVDLNNESVEITKLSLWLKTANKYSELTALDNNIKCGNSLIDDPAVAGFKAFNWEKEFPQVFREKQLKAFHITWVTYNSRVSERMKTYQKVIIRRRLNKGLQPLVHSWQFDEEMELEVTKVIRDIILENKYTVPAFNICDDHIHILIICEEEELSDIVRKLKGKSSQKIKEYLNIDKDSEFHLWAQKFNTSFIESDEKLYNTIQYINNNRIKHDLSLNKGLQPPVQEMITHLETAFKPQYVGGFDVIIGNPPWGAKLTKEIIDYLTTQYAEISSGEIDSYIVFIIKGIKLLKINGYLGFIVPDTWLSLQRTHNLRKYIYENTRIIDIYDRYKPFDDAKDTRSHTFIIKKHFISDYNFKVKISDSHFNVIKDYDLNSGLLKNYSEWNLYKSNDENMIFQKMVVKSKQLKELYNIKYGLRTGNNQKYLSNIDVNKLGLKIARGSHIQRYYFNWFDEYLILKEGLPSSYFQHNNLQEKIILQYVRTNSTDNKSKWLEATIIEEENYVPLNSTSYIYEKDSSKLKYLLTILSSYLMNFYYRSHYTDVNVKPIYLEKLPIPEIVNQLPFIELADIMLEKNKELRGIKNKFVDLLKADFNLEKISTKLQNWYELNWSELAAELKKLKVELKGELKEDWKERFDRLKAKAVEIRNLINTTDRKIDLMVYELYGLTEEEIRIVEGEESILNDEC